MMQAGKQLGTAAVNRDLAAATTAAEGFMDLAFARGLSVQAPFGDKPYILELRMPAGADGKLRRVYADFRQHELMHLEGERVIRECLDELSFVPALLQFCRRPHP